MASDTRDLRFVIVPKVVHPWFTEVHRGALLQAEFLQQRIRSRIAVDYLPPPTADVGLQDAIISEAVAGSPSGLAIDPVDAVANLPAMTAARHEGIPVVLFDSPSSNPAFPSIGNDFSEQGAIAAERLVGLIDQTGEVAIMQGFPTAPNHRQRHRAQLEVLRKHPSIAIVDGGIDNDDIPTAKQQATAVLAAHPHLDGYLCCDASAPIGIAAAIREADRIGAVKVVAVDAIDPILNEIKGQVLDSAVATIPHMQGAMALLMLWQACEGMRVPQKIDTGLDLVTADNVDEFLARSIATGT